MAENPESAAAPFFLSLGIGPRNNGCVPVEFEQMIVRNIHDDGYLAGRGAACADVVAHLPRYGQHAIGKGHAEAFGPSDERPQPGIAPLGKHGIEQFRHRFMQMKNHLGAHEARNQRGKNKIVRHGIDLNTAEAMPQMKSDQVNRRQQKEGVVLEKIPADLTATVTYRQAMDLYATNVLPRCLILFPQANDMHLIAVIEQRLRLPPNIEFGGIAAMAEDTDRTLALLRAASRHFINTGCSGHS